MISESMVCSTQTVHLSCVKISTISERNKTSFHLSLCHLVVPSGAFKTISEPMVHLAQTMHLSCTDTNTVSKWEIPHDPRHLGVSSGASKMISEPMVRLAQTMHLSCTDTNTVSERKEVRFDMTHITLEFHQVRPNDFRAFGTFDENHAPILRQD